MASRLIALLISASFTGCVAAGCSAPATGHTKSDPGPAKSGPTTTLTSGVTLGKKWEFTYFKDSHGEDCIAVNYGGASGVPACNFEVDDRYPIDAAIQQVSPKVAAVYGEVAEGITTVEFVRKSSTERLATFARPNSGRRCFVVLAIDKDVNDIYVNTPTGRTSLKGKLSEFYAPG